MLSGAMRGAGKSGSDRSSTSSAFVPLTFEPGEAYQFDWSHEIVVLAMV